MSKFTKNIINLYYITELYILNNFIYIQIILIYLMSGGETYLCDDNLPTGGWGGELDGRPIVSNNQTTSAVTQDLPPSYETHESFYRDSNGVEYGYKENGVHESFYRDSNGNEYGWKDNTRHIDDSFYRDSNGNEYGWKEGVDYPDYNGSQESTLLGEIEPVRSEVLGRGYYPLGRPIPDTSKSSLSRRMYIKAKISVKNHIAKSNDMALAESRRKSETFAKNLQRHKDLSRAHKNSRIINMHKETNISKIKVKRFD